MRAAGSISLSLRHHGFVEQSRAVWLHYVVRIVLKAWWAKVSFHSVSGEGTLPSRLWAHMLEKEKALVSSSYEGTAVMVNDPYL